MSSMQLQARALGDPTRHQIFQHIVDADHPVDVEELTAAFGFNHNAIRQHLAKLVAAGLVLEDKAVRVGPGRPRLVYTIDPAAEGRWGTVGPYERLSVLLTEIIRTGDSPVEVGRRAALQFPIASTPVESSIADTARAMATQGFEPEVRQRGSRVEIVLNHCPFESAVLTDRSVVCDLHLGMAEGMVEDTNELVLDELIAKDPRSAGCRLRYHVEQAD